MFNEIIDKEYAISNNSFSEGTQEKYYKDGYWYKIDQTGCESYAEFLTSKLLELSDILPDKYVKYEMGKINGKQGCRSKSFLKPGETFITIYRLYQTLYGKNISDEIALLPLDERYKFVNEFIYKETGLNPKEVFSFLFNVDAFTLNDDRHFNNIGFVKRNDNTYNAAPIFDNGRGFLNGNISYNKNFSIQENCNRVVAKPFCGDHVEMALYYKDKTNFHFMKFKKFLIEAGIPKELENNIFAKRIYDVALFRTEEYIKKNIRVLPSEVSIDYKKENNIIK